MAEIKNNFYFTSLKHDLEKLSAIYRKEFLSEALHHTMDDVFKNAYNEGIFTSDDEQQPVKRGRGRPRKQQ